MVNFHRAPTSHRIFGILEPVEGKEGRVLQTAKTGLRLRSNKGISFPATRPPPRPLDAEDERALDFAPVHADGVNVSFVNTPRDVRLIGERIGGAGAPASA